MQELGKFDFKINVIWNGLEKLIIFNTNNKLIFIDNFQSLNFSWENLIRKLGKNDFKFFS